MNRDIISKDNWKRWGGGVLVTCPGCKTTMPLDHTVDAEGNVSPSLDCPMPSCTYHEFAKLEGWKES